MRDSIYPPGTPSPGRIESFEGAGGRELRFRVVGEVDRRHRLLYLHGIESHSTWFLPVAHRLADHGCVTYLLDRRGSGLNLAPSPGDTDSARTLLEDVRLFREHVGSPEFHVVGLSWGGKLAVAATLEQPRRLLSLTLITPGLKSRVALSLWQKLFLLSGCILGWKNRLKIPISPEMFTETPLYLEFIRNDPWRLTTVTARFLLASLKLDRHIARSIPSLRPPVLLFLAGRDPIIDNHGVLRMLSALPKEQLRLEFLEAAAHSLEFDQADFLVTRMSRFFEEWSS
jgi:pimeloyl-ACP methyl ester carboxylesterase